MKIARFFGIVFGILGILLMAGTAGLCFVSLDAPTQVAQVPQAGLNCAREVMDAIAAGDLNAASRRIYGQPDLGVSQELSSEASRKLWQTFADSLSYEFQGPCYVTDQGFVQDVLVTGLDITTITQQVDGYARELLNERIAAATEMAELYDEAGEFRTDLVDAVMAQALEKALAQGGQMRSVSSKLSLVCREDAWWAIPDEALLNFLGGGV